MENGKLRKRNCEGVSANCRIVALKPDKILLEHGMLVATNTVGPSRLHGADSHPRNKVLRQQRPTHSLRAFDCLGVRRTFQKTAYPWRGIILREFREFTPVLNAQFLSDTDRS